MPIISSYDGVNRRIFLDASIANSSWTPLDAFKEYLAYRRDTEQFRGFEPLIRMQGGQPTATGQQPRFLQMLTDSRGILTKFVLPDIGPYRTRVDGAIETDQPGTDPEPFDVTNLTTTGVILDYKPVEAEVITVATGSGLSPAEQAQLEELWRLKGLDSNNPVVIDKQAGTISFAGITITITGDTDARTLTRS